MKNALLVLVLGCASASGQIDPASMAAQQAMQSSSLQAGQQMQQDMLNSAMAAQQQALQSMQQAQDQMLQLQASTQFQAVPRNSAFDIFSLGLEKTELPVFSVKSGTVEAGRTVRIKWRSSRYAVVYYTTDGWTPTLASTPYTSPITINATTHLQAVAFGYNVRSAVVKGDFRVDSLPATPPVQMAYLSTDGMLHAGTRLRLTIGSEISSETAHAGDKAALQLDQDVKLGDTVVIPKGTPVDAVLTRAGPAVRSKPGDLVLRMHALNLQGKSIPLKGTEFLEGQTGKEAVIKPGMVVTATVATDTPLTP
jgi:Chitobiase/beta-hexosaminidase C-terminal domain